MADKIGQGIVIIFTLIFGLGLLKVAWLIKTNQI